MSWRCDPEDRHVMARLPGFASAGRHPVRVLGHSHALSGLAAGAATLPWAPVEGTVAQVAWVAAVGGFAMLPDLDHSGSTVSDMWGPVTDVPSGAIGRLAQGHRWGTHDAVLGPLAFGALAVAAAGAFWSSLLLMALAIGLALRALNFVIPGRTENTVRRQHRPVLGRGLVAARAQPEPRLAALGGGARLPHPHRRRRAHHGRDPGAADLGRPAQPAEAAADPDRRLGREDRARARCSWWPRSASST